MLQKGVFPDLVATSGDYLRIWRVGDPEVRLECLLNNVSYSISIPFVYKSILLFLKSDKCC